MATEMHWYSGSAWNKATEMYVWDGAEWKKTIRMYIYDQSSTSWRLCHVSPSACYNFNGDSIGNTGACAGGNNSVFYSNCTNPYNDYTGTNCYIYTDTCGPGYGVGDTYVQLNIGGTQYNFDTDVNSLITYGVEVNC